MQKAVNKLSLFLLTIIFSISFSNQKFDPIKIYASKGLVFFYWADSNSISRISSIWEQIDFDSWKKKNIIDYKNLGKIRSENVELYDVLRKSFTVGRYSSNRLIWGLIDCESEASFDLIVNILQNQEKRIERNENVDYSLISSLESQGVPKEACLASIDFLNNLVEIRKKGLKAYNEFDNLWIALERNERNQDTIFVVGGVSIPVAAIAYKLYKKIQKAQKRNERIEQIKNRFDALGVKPFVPKAPKPPKSPLVPGACACPTQAEHDDQDNYQSVDSATYAAGGESLSAGAAGAAASVVPVKLSAQEKKKARRGIGTHTRRGGFKPRTQVPVSPSAAAASTGSTVDTKHEKTSPGRYTLMRTAEFARAYEDLSDADRARIDSRMHDAQYGRFGDHHALNSGSNSATRIDAEFRWPTGLRVYYTIVIAGSSRTVYLLRIGDKSSAHSQTVDISRARSDADIIHAGQ